jgi:hypothetical protein
VCCGGWVQESGIGSISDVSWRTWFCRFCPTTKDPIDILVPYFETSLANSRLCLWITSEPLVERIARGVMANARSDFARYVDQLHFAASDSTREKERRWAA